MFCEKCGYQVEDDSSFCHNCGTKIEQVQVKKDIAKEDTEQPIISNNEKTKQKSKLIGLLIAIVAIVVFVVCFGNKNISVDSEKSNTNTYAELAEITTPENRDNNVESITSPKAEIDVYQETENSDGVRLGWYSNTESNPSIGILTEYVGHMLLGRIDEMFAMIADEEYLLTVQNMPKAITSFKEYYTKVYEEQRNYSNEYIPLTQFDRCYVADWEMFLEFVGMTEEEVPVDYLDDYERYYVYTGVCYGWYNMQTDDLTEYKLLTPNDTVIIGEKNSDFELLVVMSDFYNM